MLLCAHACAMRSARLILSLQETSAQGLRTLVEGKVFAPRRRGYPPSSSCRGQGPRELGAESKAANKEDSSAVRKRWAAGVKIFRAHTLKGRLGNLLTCCQSRMAKGIALHLPLAPWPCGRARRPILTTAGDPTTAPAPTRGTACVPQRQRPANAHAPTHARTRNRNRKRADLRPPLLGTR